MTAKLRTAARPLRHPRFGAIRQGLHPALLSLAAALACATAAPAQAAVLTWNGGGVDNSWGTPANWGGTSIVVGDSLVFAGNTRLNATNNYAGLVPLASISFAANAGAFVQTNIALASTSVSSGITNASSNLQTLNLRLGVAGSQTWDGGSAGMLFNSAVTLGANALVLSNKSTINNAGLSFAVGDTGTAALTVASGSAVQANFGQLGTAAAAVGSLTVTGAGSTWASAAGLDVGGSGVGNLNVAAGGVVNSGQVYIGRDSTGAALASSAKVSGTGSSWTSTASIAINNGTLLVDNGAAVSTENAFAGLYSRGTGSITVQGTGSQFNVNNGIFLGTGAAGTTGTLNVLVGASASASGIQVGKQGVLNLAGGTLNLGKASNSSNAGAFNWTGGQLHFSGDASFADGSLLARSTTLITGQVLRVDGQLNLDSDTTLALTGGQLNGSTLNLSGQASVGRGSTLSASTRLSNFGSLTLAGGTLSGAGVLFNTTELNGFGRIDGAGGFINTGLLTQAGGDLVLSNTGDNLNTGTWNLLAGRQLILNSGVQLTNAGALKLGGGLLAGEGVLLNTSQGTISGNGSINSGFVNQGSLVIGAGLTQVLYSFVNRGQILLGADAATLSGAQIGNHGAIQGYGKVNNNISNIDPIGSIAAQGGTLTLAGQIVSPNAGIFAANNGATLLLSQGLASNAGKIQLAGGTLDNNGVALVNEAVGTISGFGTLRGGLLTNKGQIQLSGGPAVPSAIYNALLATDASKTIVTGNANATFYGTADFQSGSELRVSSGAIVTFFDMVQQRTGAKFTGSGAKRFDGGITVGASPGLGTDEGDVEFGESNFYIAEIGGLTACTLACGTDAVFRDHSFDKYIVAGSLSFGGELRITSWNGFVAQAGQRFDLFDWGTTTGSFSSIDASGFKLAAGTKLDYSALYTTGVIAVTTAVPEPGSYALLMAGLGVLGFVARRRRMS